MDRQYIHNLLMTNDRAVARALVVLYERQTADEQNAESTSHTNGRGFNQADARMGTSMAKFFLKNSYLSSKQIQYWRIEDRRGTPRICKYAGQLLEAAEEKAARQAVAA